jgi:hypothetical protein
MCHFVPAYILQHIADSEAAPEEARQAAIRTLSADQGFREQRVCHAKACQAPHGASLHLLTWREELFSPSPASSLCTLRSCTRRHSWNMRKR